MTAPASRYVTGRENFPRLKSKLLPKTVPRRTIPKLYHNQIGVEVGVEVGDAEGEAVEEDVGFGVGVAEGLAVAPFLSPVTIETSVVPEVAVVAMTF